MLWPSGHVSLASYIGGGMSLYAKSDTTLMPLREIGSCQARLGLLLLLLLLCRNQKDYNAQV